MQHNNNNLTPADGGHKFPPGRAIGDLCRWHWRFLTNTVLSETVAGHLPARAPWHSYFVARLALETHSQRSVDDSHVRERTVKPQCRYGCHERTTGGRINFALGGAVASLAVAFSLPAFTQDQGRIRQGMDVYSKAGCATCHGNEAQGGGGGEQPAGPNLRESRLTPDQFAETVACGRPGTPMPYNLQGAYTVAACYGLPIGQAPPVVPGARLTADEIGVLVEYIKSMK